MKDGIISGVIPPNYLYADPIQRAADKLFSSAFLAYSIAEVETIDGQAAGMWDAANVVSADGGHGLFQLTSSFPPNWEDSYTNATFAISNFIIPACDYWADKQRLAGDSLVRAIAAEFNAGRANALAGHALGNVGLYTTKSDGVQYDARVLANYHSLLKIGY